MRLISLVLGAALAAPLPLAAQPAAPAPPDTHGPTPNPGGPAPLTVTPPSPDVIARRLARRAARVDQDIQALHAGLQLTPAQDALWPPVADAIHAVDTARGFRFRQTMAAAPSTNDSLKLQGDHMAAMGAALSRLASAARPLVTTLSPDQKSRLPGLLQGLRLPKAMSRALDLPQDTPRDATSPLQQGPDRTGAGADRAWRIGPQNGAGGAGVTASPRKDEDDQ